MNLRLVIEIFAAVAAGMLIPVQTGFNTQLARALQSPLLSTVVVFAAGLVVMSAVALVARTPWPGWTQALTAPPITWVAGGILGATYLLALLLLAPRLGAGALVVLVMVGQLGGAALLDHFGLLGFAEHALNPQRLAGLALVAAGALLVRFY